MRIASSRCLRLVPSAIVIPVAPSIVLLQVPQSRVAIDPTIGKRTSSSKVASKRYLDRLKGLTAMTTNQTDIRHAGVAYSETGSTCACDLIILLGRLQRKQDCILNAFLAVRPHKRYLISCLNTTKVLLPGTENMKTAQHPRHFPCAHRDGERTHESIC